MPSRDSAPPSTMCWCRIPLRPKAKRPMTVNSYSQSVTNQAGNLSEGFVIRQVKGNAEGWTYDETKFYAIPMFADTYTNVAGWTFLKYDENAELDYNNPIEEIGFTNSYNAKKPVTPPAPQKTESPKTGDSSMAGLWIALLFVSGCCTHGNSSVFPQEKSK